MTPPDALADDRLTSDDFDALEDLLDGLRVHDDEVPQWEFLDGAIAGLLCCRTPVAASDYFPVLLGVDPTLQGDAAAAAAFDHDAIAQARFAELWARRMAQVAESLDVAVESLDDERTYQPETVDVRGAIAALPEAERAEALAGEGAGALPSYAQVWALGFMYVVENWPEEFVPPKDKETAGWMDEALDAMVALTEDDNGTPVVSAYSEDGPPSVSQQRLDGLGSAVWAVYDLRQLARSLGPRTEPVRRAETPGRNDPCPCGSAKKYKKCHGA